MLLDIIKTIIGDLPNEYEFIYYIVTCGCAISLLSLPLTPILLLLKGLIRRR